MIIYLIFSRSCVASMLISRVRGEMRECSATRRTQTMNTNLKLNSLWGWRFYFGICKIAGTGDKTNFCLYFLSSSVVKSDNFVIFDLFRHVSTEKSLSKVPLCPLFKVYRTKKNHGIPTCLWHIKHRSFYHNYCWRTINSPAVKQWFNY